MSSLQQQQHLVDTVANLNAQLCELNELRAQVRKALQFVPKTSEPKHWNGEGEICRSTTEMDS
jgi:hypothetical protein